MKAALKTHNWNLADRFPVTSILLFHWRCLPIFGLRYDQGYDAGADYRRRVVAARRPLHWRKVPSWPLSGHSADLGMVKSNILFTNLAYLCLTFGTWVIQCCVFPQAVPLGPRGVTCLSAKCTASQEPLAQLRGILHAGGGNEILVAINDVSCLPTPRCALKAAADSAGRTRLWLKQLCGRAPLPPPLTYGAVDFDPPPYLTALHPPYGACVQQCVEAHEEWIRGTAAAVAAAASAPLPTTGGGSLPPARAASCSVPYSPPLHSASPLRAAPAPMGARTVKLTLRLRHVVHAWLMQQGAGSSKGPEIDPLSALQNVLQGPEQQEEGVPFAAQVVQGGSGVHTCPHVDVQGNMWKLPRPGGWCKDDSVWSLRHFRLRCEDGNMYRYKDGAGGDKADVLDLRRLFQVKCSLEHAVQHPWTAHRTGPASPRSPRRKGRTGAVSPGGRPSSAIALQVTGRYAGQDFTRSFIAGAVAPAALQEAATSQLPEGTRLACILQCRVWLAALLGFGKLTDFTNSKSASRKAIPVPASWCAVMMPGEAVAALEAAETHRRHTRRRILNAEQYARECAEAEAMRLEDVMGAAVRQQWDAERNEVLAARHAESIRRLAWNREHMQLEEEQAKALNAVWRKQEACKRRLQAAVAALRGDVQSAQHQAGSAQARVGLLSSQKHSAARELANRQQALHDRQVALAKQICVPVYQRLLVWVPPLLLNEGGSKQRSTPHSSSPHPPHTHPIASPETGTPSPVGSPIRRLLAFAGGASMSTPVSREARRVASTHSRRTRAVSTSMPATAATPSPYGSRRRKLPTPTPAAAGAGGALHGTPPAQRHTLRVQLPSDMAAGTADSPQKSLAALLPLQCDRWGRVSLHPPVQLYRWLAAQAHISLVQGGASGAVAARLQVKGAQQQEAARGKSTGIPIKPAGVRYLGVRTSVGGGASGINSPPSAGALSINASLVKRLDAAYAWTLFVLKDIEQPPGELLQGGDVLLSWGGVPLSHLTPLEEISRRCMDRVLQKGTWVEVARPIGRVPAASVGQAPPVELWSPPSAVATTPPHSPSEQESG